MARENLKRQDLINKLEAKKGIADLPGWCDWTANQVETYIEDNVTDLASAKIVLKKMAQMLVLLRDGVIK